MLAAIEKEGNSSARRITQPTLLSSPLLLPGFGVFDFERFGLRLFTLGIPGYLFYQYLMYAVTWAFGPLFLLFVAIYMR